MYMATHPTPPKAGTRRDLLMFKYYELYNLPVFKKIVEASARTESKAG